MPPFLIGVAVGVGAQFADGLLKDALHSHSDFIDITWVDLAVIGAALYFSPKGSGVGVIGGWVASMWLRGHLATVAAPGAPAVVPPTVPPITKAPAAAGPAVTNPGPGFTNVVFSSSPRDAGPLVFTSGGGPGQM